MNNELLTEKVVECLLDEFQSVWIVKIDDLSMTPFRLNLFDIPENVAALLKSFSSYPKARECYLSMAIVPQDVERLAAETAVENVIERISDGKAYYIQYSRRNGDNVNYNQIVYKGIESEEGNIEYFILGFRDIDIRKKAERDNLTGLYTRKVFLSKAEQMLRDDADSQYDLMVSDIVDFKVINETYGTSMGDEILSWSGKYLSGAIKPGMLVGRYGGDQFVVLCKHEVMLEINEANNREYFDEARKAMNFPRFTVKYGIYENVDHDATIVSLCDKAHMALNSIKHTYGKYIEYYNDNIKEELDKNRRIENVMHQALEQEQFKVFYQPKHSAETGKLIGAEALIRWIHPEYGFMSPAEFIPLFETNGFIAETDYFVWKKVCANLRKWKDAGLNIVPISVNASKITFRQRDLIQYLQSVVEENGISADMLHLEITETLMETNTEALVRKLTAIRTIGYQVELDDFGSGYSSINILSTLPMDVVKLDMSFMKEFGNEKRAKVLAACIKLAKELGYKTISEGVESSDQHKVLESLGVDAIQGYYYSKPLPEHEFEEYLKTYSN